MRRVACFALFSAFVGCESENKIGGDYPEYGPSNPAPVLTPWREDQITQVTTPVVDALFVVDNSCSMDVEQANLAANFPPFLAWFLDSGLDYHIGVTSTDMNDPAQAGRLRESQGVRWVQSDTVAPETVFADMATIGISGSAAELGFDATFAALDTLATLDNLGFQREGSGVHVTVVSDENNAPGGSITREEFIDWMNGLRWSQRMVTFSSIVGPTTGCPDIGSAGVEYEAATAAVGGVVWPICSDDWVSVLDQLGALAIGLSKEFYLSQMPVPGSVSVSLEVDGVMQNYFVEGVDWTYSGDRNSISFTTRTPNPLEVVHIRYQVLSLLEHGTTPSTEPPPQ
jgi:hypothetical protein